MNTEYKILLYHGVYDDSLDIGQKNSSGKHISQSRFEKELELLKKTRPVVSIPEIIAAHRGDHNIEHGSVAVTFDDGFLNNYEVAWPLLEKYEIPAMFYLATGFIDTGNIIWTDKLESALLSTHENEVVIKIDEGIKVYALNNIEERINALSKIKTICKLLCNSMLNEIISSIIQQLKPVNDISHSLYQFMNWEQVINMNNSALIEFGAHTINHVSLANESNDQIWKEINESLNTVSEKLGEKCNYFAYPGGQENDFNDNVINVLRDLGLDHCVTAISGTNFVKFTDPFHIHRDMVGFQGAPFPITV